MHSRNKDSRMADSDKATLDYCVIQFEVGDRSIPVEVWDAGDVLSREVDAKHAGDAEGAQEFLDTTAALMQERWGFPRCSRRAAWQFYETVVAKLEELKKTTGSTPASATGSEPTAAIGPNGESAPDSKTSPDVTPSEMCASLT